MATLVVDQKINLKIKTSPNTTAPFVLTHVTYWRILVGAALVSTFLGRWGLSDSDDFSLKVGFICLQQQLLMSTLRCVTPKTIENRKKLI